MIDTYPIAKNKTAFSEKLATVSPHFVRIYHQAEMAEAQGMTEICGMGYRKALEFLVKDFACMMNPDEEDDIKKLPLSACINNYIESNRIKTLATASAWLGNDETHYVRKHEDYDTEDMKIFIKSLVPFIESELAFLEAQEFIESKKK